jgi:hypothetical protein
MTAIMRSLRTRWVALLTALAVLLPATAFGRTHYFCRMMDRVVASCCCAGSGGHDQNASCGPRVRATDCCDEITTGTRSNTLPASGTDFQVPPAALRAMVSAAVYLVPRSGRTLTAPVQARAPPGVGPPLFIIHCSLLT